jgi:hypothetical protein
MAGSKTLNRSRALMIFRFHEQLIGITNYLQSAVYFSLMIACGSLSLRNPAKLAWLHARLSGSFACAIAYNPTPFDKSYEFVYQKFFACTFSSSIKKR